MGEPDRCQGQVRQVVVFDHRVAGRKDLIHHDGPLRGHRRVGALVLLRVNPCHGHGLESAPRAIGHEHLVSAPHLAREYRRHPLPCRAVAAHEEEVRGGQGDLLARVGFDHVEESPGRRVLVYEHDEVGVNGVPVAIRSQDPVAGSQVFELLLGAILEADGGRAREATA